MRRREFLALSGSTCGAQAFAFPVPWARMAAQPKPALSDALPALPPDAIRRLGSARFRTGKGISRLQFNPAGSIIVGADRDDIRGWDAATAAPIFTIPYPSRMNLTAGRVTSRDTIAVIGKRDDARDYEIQHLDFRKGGIDRVASTTLNGVDSAVFNRDGSRVAAIRNNKLTLFDGLKTGELWGLSFTANDRVVDLLFVHNDEWLVIAERGRLRYFDVETGKEREPLKSPQPKKARGDKPITSLVTTPTGHRLAGICGDDLFIWNLETGELVQSIKEKEHGSLFGFSPDGGTLYAHQDGQLRVYETGTGQRLKTLDLGPIYQPILSPLGTVLASCPHDCVVLTDVATGDVTPLSADPPGQPAELRFQGPQTLLGLLSYYGGWVKWDLATGASRLLRAPGQGEAFPLGLSRDGLALYGKQDKFTVVNLPTREVRGTLEAGGSRSLPLGGLTADGRWAVSVTAAGLRTLDTKTGQTAELFPGGEGREEPDHFILAEQSDIAAISYRQGNGYNRMIVELFTLSSGRLKLRLRVNGTTQALAVSPDGSTLAITTLGNYSSRRNISRNHNGLSIYDVETGTIRFQSTFKDVDATRLALSPDNRLIALSQSNDTIVVWEIATGAARLSFKATGETQSLTFAPDCNTLANACNGGPILIWDLRGRQRTRPVKPGDQHCRELLGWLADKDPVTAYEALRLVAAWPEVTLPVIAKAIPPVAPPDEIALNATIQKLDSPIYRDREKASDDLLATGELAVPSMKRALAGTDSSELRERLEFLLSRIAITPANLQALRAVEAVEWIADAKAKSLLQAWASGAAGARLTRDALAALRRIR